MNSALLLLALSNMLFFALHIGTIGSFPKPLSKEEEMDCFIRMKQGDKSARDKLIEHNLRLVAHIIKKAYSRRKIFLCQSALHKSAQTSGKSLYEPAPSYFLFSQRFYPESWSQVPNLHHF